MKSHKKLLSLILSLSTLICCFANLSVIASDIDVSSYTYVVDNMAFYNGDKQLSSPEGATEVAVDVTERIPTEESNTVIISAYSADGTFLGMNHSSQNFAFAKTQNIKLSLDIPTGKTVSEIRAFVWNSFNDMMPLSNALSSNSNTIIESKIVYATGEFSAINSQNKLIFYSLDTGSSGFTLDPNDTSLKYHIYLNGEEITTADLMAGDILSIAYDISADLSATMALINSKYYEIYVSRNIVSGAVDEIDTNNCRVKINDTYYSFLNTTKYNSFSSSADIGDSYHFTLDALGRIYSWEFDYSSIKWAIVEKFKKLPSEDEYKLTMFTANGELRAYYFDANKASVTLTDNTVINKTTEGSTDALNTAVKNLIYTTETTKTAIEDRVIQYKVSSSSGKITDLKFMRISDSTIDEFAGTTKETYSARRNAIGVVSLGDITRIIDATQYASKEELSQATWENLIDGAEYAAYAYGTRVDNAYQFVLITESAASDTGDDNVTVTPEIRFAVVTEDGYDYETDEETGDIIYTISAMCGDTEKLAVSDDISTTTLDNLKKGEVIIFKTNSKGQIYHINELFTWSGVPTQAALATGSLVNENTDYSNLTALTINNITGENFSANFTHDWNSTSTDAIKIVYGPVMERTDNEIAFGKIDANGKTNTFTGVTLFDFSDDIRVYTYDYSKGEKYRFENQGNATSAIGVTSLIESNMEADKVTVDWNKDADLDGVKENQETVTFAFAIVVNDEVQDILAFLPK